MSTKNIDVNNIQGDIILGLQKRVETFQFFTIHDSIAFRHILRNKIAPLITSTADVQKAQENINKARNNDKNVILDIVHTNISFTSEGLEALGINAADHPGQAGTPDSAFLKGQAQDAIDNLGDPAPNSKLTTWEPIYLNTTIHGAFIITAPNTKLLEQRVREISRILSFGATFAFSKEGVVRPGAEAAHEHFGFLDGISQPRIKGFNDTSANDLAGVVEPQVILNGHESGFPSLNSKKNWSKDGSFLVFRQLQQLVPEFNQFLVDAAVGSGLTGLTPEFIGARVVGRWKSGAPISLAPIKDDPTLRTAQNFDYSDADELLQKRCPYVAHIRKTNPRKGLNPSSILPHLMIRSGIPYGQEVTQAEKDENKTIDDRGLLFVSYQSSIINGFQFVQKNWCNNTAFPPNSAKINTPGPDLLIGANSNSGPRTSQNVIPKGTSGNTDPNNLLTAPIEFIIPRGGVYMFSPSISSLKNRLSQT